MPFGEPRRKQAHLIVVALDVIEPAALPPVPPAALRFVCPLIRRQRRGRRGKPRFDRFEAGRQRIVDRDETALFRQIERQRDANEIAGLVRKRRRRATRRSRRTARICARCEIRCRTPADTDDRRRNSIARRRTACRFLRARTTARAGFRAQPSPPASPSAHHGSSPRSIGPGMFRARSRRSPASRPHGSREPRSRISCSRRPALPSRWRSPACCPSARSSVR